MAVASRVVEDNVKRSDPQWRRNAKGKFFRLADIEPPPTCRMAAASMSFGMAA